MTGTTVARLMIAATIVVAYLLGSFPTGYLVAKYKGIDIRQAGSGSIGNPYNYEKNWAIDREWQDFG